ncbi:Trehalose and maltose hydrolase (possible phosphorylase) [Georgenia satyanarayanai]|uniref:Trehalose and maltose hydrolase (Possible phosphorylase) n=1 Tax=Georgenia satyanarayanai TaxID=860221 RepID=A0A2Y9ALL0_9MICO|nr:glycosyl hydrolase family 65 protein [Georgenia satyanarayanai]PYF98351.1 trehalose/maltose hydrolase-like predicted phosphorylase [Georgenia satyanarayanai]SSA44936.1 Trehalose and maltose hydrolase (possible phosphorylase) [Georgenia satyanarayanai]
MTAPHLEVHPWEVREPRVDPERFGAAEALFSLSNGYLGVRGTLDEADPCVSRASFLSGVFETHPLAYPEGGYGHPEEGQAIVAVADGTPLRLTVDGAALDVREIEPEVHERRLDLRAGTLDRVLRWRAPSGTTLELRTRRLVSLTERSVLAVRYELRALDGPAHVVVRSELTLGTCPPEIHSDDPRVSEALEHPFEVLTAQAAERGGSLALRTRRTGIGVAAAVEHDVDGATTVESEAGEDRVVMTVVADLAPGRDLRLTKTVGYTWAHDMPADSLVERAVAAVRAGEELGWDGLLTGQRRALDDFWARADVEVDGDPELQQALRYDLFQLHCSSARISHAPVGAKGLTGAGYNGHTFWDIEGFVLPVLSLLVPDAAAEVLRWRASTLDAARQRAAVLDWQGATFAWRTIDGHETSAYWPASTAAVHVNAAVSRAFWVHSNVTGRSLDEVGGREVLVETARLWMSIGHEGADGGWHLLGVTGPDEYTGVVDDNVFTNLMARRNLIRAAEACESAPERARELGVTEEEVRSWRAAADAVHVPWDEHRGVHPANAGFTTYREWRFADKRDSYPVEKHHHYAKFYRRQVVKQADLELALWWCREDFTDEEAAADLEYYEARTVRDSSLSASAQAVACAVAEHPDLALSYLREAALVDLRDIQEDTAEGLHLASMGGSWLALAAGLGGLREIGEELELAPLLPARLTRTCFHVTWRGSLLRVETTTGGTTLSVLDGPAPVAVVVDGVRHEVGGKPVTVPLRDPAPLRTEPTQPEGRAPGV